MCVCYYAIKLQVTQELSYHLSTAYPAPTPDEVSYHIFAYQRWNICLLGLFDVGDFRTSSIKYQPAYKV